MNSRCKYKSAVIISAVLALLATTAFGQSTRRKGIKAAEPVVPEPEIFLPVNDTISDIEVINKTIRIEGFKKAVASRVEAVLITNNSASDTIRGVEADIDYRTLDGKQLNRRTVTFSVDVPPSETRHVSVESWDKQQLFYHYDTPPVRKTGRTTPFKITLTPLRIIVSKPAL